MRPTLQQLSVPLLFLVLAGVPDFAFSQGNSDSHTITVTIPEVALLDIETNDVKDFTAAFTHSGEAGDGLTRPDDNTGLWLNYSSILKSGGAATRSISVSMTGGPLAGITITVAAGGIASGAVGTAGTAAGPVTLSSTPTPLISGIGSVYTVDGPEKGHQLTYSLEASDDTYATLRSGSTSNVFTVTYTLSDN